MTDIVLRRRPSVGASDFCRLRSAQAEDCVVLARRDSPGRAQGRQRALPHSTGAGQSAAAT
jgi:hypothetical protein